MPVPACPSEPSEMQARLLQEHAICPRGCSKEKHIRTSHSGAGAARTGARSPRISCASLRCLRKEHRAHLRTEERTPPGGGWGGVSAVVWGGGRRGVGAWEQGRFLLQSGRCCSSPARPLRRWSHTTSLALASPLWSPGRLVLTCHRPLGHGLLGPSEPQAGDLRSLSETRARSVGAECGGDLVQRGKGNWPPPEQRDLEAQGPSPTTSISSACTGLTVLNSVRSEASTSQSGC